MQPIADVHKELTAKLWPWDESKCRVCGYAHTPKDQYCWMLQTAYPPAQAKWAEAPLDLTTWSGVGQVVEAMQARGYCVSMYVFHDLPPKACVVKGSRLCIGYGTTILECVARAALRAVQYEQ